jgi:hypothetical protein
MPSKRRRQGRTKIASSPKALGLLGAAAILGGAAIVRTAMPLAGERVLSRTTAVPVLDPPMSAPQIEIWQLPAEADAIAPAPQHKPSAWLKTLAGPAALLQAIWMAIFALTALVWLQFIPSAVSDGIVTWPIPSVWPKHSQSVAHVANAIKVPPPSTLGLAFLVALLFAAVATFAWALMRVRALQEGNNRILWFILGGAAIMGLTMVFLPVLPSGDVISYIAYGRIDVLYHANALIDVPGKFPHDPFLAYNYWDDLAAYYGPVWLMAGNGLTLLAQALGGSQAVYILVFKLFSFTGFLVCGVLIWDILSHIAPQRRVMGTLLWAWNPLAIWEFGAGGHNDPLMLALFLGGIALMVRGREVPGLLCWGLAIGAKYTLIVLLPLYLWYLLLHGWQRGGSEQAHSPLRRALSGEDRPVVRDFAAIKGRVWGVIWRGALVVSVVVVCLIPFWDGRETFATLISSPSVERTTNSVPDTLRWPVQSLLIAVLHMHASVASEMAVTILKVLGLAGFVILFVWQVLHGAARNLAKAWGWVVLGLLLFTITWFYPWYTSWLLMVVALRPLDRLSKAGIILAASVLLTYLLSGISATAGWRGAALWLPMLGYLGWTWWQEQRQKAPMGDLGATVTDVVEVRQGT